MSWSLKDKIEQSGSDEKILTPDGEEILVGSPETDVLLYGAEFSNWDLKTKVEP